MQDNLDLLLERAVRSYTAGGPSPELAKRILQQAQPGRAGCIGKVRGGKVWGGEVWSRAFRSRSRVWALSFSLVSAAVLLLALLLTGKLALPHPPTILAPRPPAVAENAAREFAAATPQEQPRKLPVLSRRQSISERKSRRAAWDLGRRPMPAPYSREELALLAFVQEHPQEADEVMEAQKHSLEPLRHDPIAITPLQIEPIKIAGLD